MNSIDLLLNRQSNPFLTEPSPSTSQLDIILKAGMKAPDHGGLLPWRFIIAEKSGLDRLSNLFESVAKKNTDDETKIAKAKNMPYRAPMIIIVTTKYHPHSKVPKQEQLVAAGCATHAMQMAAFAQGLGAMWRTGDFSYNSEVKQGLDIDFDEDIVGYLYLGTINKKLPTKPEKCYEDFVEYL
ncbi:MAG: NAD(P)H nitroreductase [Thalassotalea sp.]